MSEDAGPVGVADEALSGLVGEGAPPLGERPALTTPTALQSHRQRLSESESLRRQPLAGLIGLCVVIPLAVLFTFGVNGAEGSIEVLGPIVTFALPAIAMIAFWWEDWPGSSLRPGWSALVDTALLVVLAIGLTLVGQALVAHVDLKGVFVPNADPAHPATFPETLVLGSTAFVAMLQITLVSERWPFTMLGRFVSGLVGLAFVWGIAIAVQLLVVNFDTIQPAVMAASGVRNPGGPVTAIFLAAWLVCLGVWQTILFVAWRGSPFRGISSQPLRVLAGNVVTIGGGWLTYLAMREWAHWQPAAIIAAGGCVIAAALLLSMLFDGWPTIRLQKDLGRLSTLAVIAVVAYGLNRGLAAIGNSIQFTKAHPDDFVTTASLAFIGTAIILHVAVWRRWPLPQGYRRSMPGR